MVNGAKLSCSQRWKESDKPIMEEWLEKMTKFSEMVKLTCLIKEKITMIFINHWTFC